MERTFSISLLNEVEDLDGDQIEDFYDSDDDGDGFSDSVEIAYGSDHRDPNSLANAAPDSLELNGSTFLENALIVGQVGELIATDPDLTLPHFLFGRWNGSQHNRNLRFTKIKSFALFIPWITKPMLRLTPYEFA